MVEEERRKNPRHELKIEAKLITPEGSFTTALANISVDGAQLESSQAVEEGTQVEISLQLGEEISISCEVVWLLDTYVDDQLLYLIGVEIEAIVLPEIRAMGLHD